MEKSPPDKKPNPNAVLKYSGLAFQIAIYLAIAVYIGQKLDAHFGTPKPYLTALCAVVALPIVFYTTLRDLF